MISRNNSKWIGSISRRVRLVASHLGDSMQLRGLSNDQKITMGALDKLRERLDNSIIRELDPDPDQDKNFPNRKSRAVKICHYVLIKPTPIAEPYLISYSEDMARQLGLNEKDVASEEFVSCFGANVWHADDDPSRHFDSWCTPYAVSVGLQPILAPDQFRGAGYGDGRVCSIGEFRTVPNQSLGDNQDERFELQLKGCGPTPFSRQFDGRAVLRSSIREFLVSEAMHFLGVPTTRALCLVGSRSEVVDRAWYRSNVNQSQHDYPPNFMVKEPCAITCRAASSFLRVGQLERCGRIFFMTRQSAESFASMKKLLIHCLNREYPHLIKGLDTSDPASFSNILLSFVSEFITRQLHLVSQWLRVGYVQGNMNSDNCNLAGLTMDYGPFGFLERYDPFWSPFTSDPEKNYGFQNQLRAILETFDVLIGILDIFIGDKSQSPEVIKLNAQKLSSITMSIKSTWGKEQLKLRSSKLGLLKYQEKVDDELLWNPLIKLLPQYDYTIFFRELSNLDLDTLKAAASDLALVGLVSRAAYVSEKDMKEQDIVRLAAWLRQYSDCVAKEDRSDGERLTAMKKANPKYIPREWMLKECYDAATKGDFDELNRLKTVLWNPYEEHEKFAEAYYRTTPEKHRNMPGVSFFSCSS